MIWDDDLARFWVLRLPMRDGNAVTYLDVITGMEFLDYL